MPVSVTADGVPGLAGLRREDVRLRPYTIRAPAGRLRGFRRLQPASKRALARRHPAVYPPPSAESIYVPLNRGFAKLEQ